MKKTGREKKVREEKRGKGKGKRSTKYELNQVNKEKKEGGQIKDSSYYQCLYVCHRQTCDKYIKLTH